MQLDLLADIREEWDNDDRLEAQRQLEAELAPVLGPLIPAGWDWACGPRAGDLFRTVRCPKCGVIEFNQYHLETNGCLCQTYPRGARVQIGPGYNGWRDGGTVYGPLWTEEDGWLDPKFQHPLTGRVWEFRAVWNDCLKQWGGRLELVEGER